MVMLRAGRIWRSSRTLPSGRLAPSWRSSQRSSPILTTASTSPGRGPKAKRLSRWAAAWRSVSPACFQGMWTAERVSGCVWTAAPAQAAQRTRAVAVAILRVAFMAGLRGEGVRVSVSILLLKPGGGGFPAGRILPGGRGVRPGGADIHQPGVSTPGGTAPSDRPWIAVDPTGLPFGAQENRDAPSRLGLKPQATEYPPFQGGSPTLPTARQQTSRQLCDTRSTLSVDNEGSAETRGMPPGIPEGELCPDDRAGGDHQDLRGRPGGPEGGLSAAGRGDVRPARPQRGGQDDAPLDPGAGAGAHGGTAGL